jgi:hypothetical protein
MHSRLFRTRGAGSATPLPRLTIRILAALSLLAC